MSRYLLTTLLLLATVQVFSQDIQTGLVASYPFCRTLDDHSPNANHGEFMGFEDPKWAKDRNGADSSAIFLNGISDYISIPSTESINGPVEELTLAAWFRYTTLYLGQWGIILSKADAGSAASRQYSLGFNSDGKVFFNTTYVAEDEFLPDAWYHLAVTYTNDTLRCYKDGLLIGTVKANEPVTANDLPLEIGRDLPGSVDYWHGFLDDINIYSRALSPQDIIALRNYDGCEPEGIFENNEPARLVVWPNPASGAVSVTLPAGVDSMVITLYSMTGQVMTEVVATSQVTTISLEGFPKGLYIVRGHHQEGQYTSKISVR